MRPLRLAVAGAAFGLALHCGVTAAAEVDHSQRDHTHIDHAQADPGHADHEQTGNDAPRTPIPELTDADRLAARPPATLHMDHDNALHSHALVDRMETWDADQGAGLAWEAGGWIGHDINRLWWRTEGERSNRNTQAADFELLFGHGFSPRWDWLAGVRHELQPRESRSFIAVGVRGLAPQWFDVSAMAYLGEDGRTAARLSTEYSLLFTNRLVLQPRVELNLYGKDDSSRGIGSGFSTAELGLRLRYEITRQFAPYLGLAWQRAFGDTAQLRRAAGDSASDTRLVAGLRIWF